MAIWARRHSVASMNTAADGRPRGDLRVGDADRDRALAELSRHFTDGRIDAAELDERTGQALQARTVAELAAPLADLPRLPIGLPQPTGLGSPGTLSGLGGSGGLGGVGAGPIMGAGPGARGSRLPLAMMVLAIPVLLVVVAVLAVGLGHNAVVIPFPLIAIAIIGRLVGGRGANRPGGQR